MSTTSVSVIVAVYNAEKTLPRLLDSLCAQTMQDFEVLLLDDGSTDGSGSICDSYAEQDKRFKVFHKQNEGIGSTRQFGIEKAAGDFTVHADADDWVEPDYLEKLYDKAVSTGADMVICDFFEEKGEQTAYVRQEPESFDSRNLAFEFMKMHGGPWNKLIKRTAYSDAGIGYVKGLEYGEDKIFNIQLALTGIHIEYLPEALYHYDVAINPHSAVREVSLKQITNREKYISILRDLLPADKFGEGLDIRNLDIVYMAIVSKSFNKEEFKKRYGFLSRVPWKKYPEYVFSIKLILWTALHWSYGFALFLSLIKKTVRRLKVFVSLL